jgi:hypothetical protein
LPTSDENYTHRVWEPQITEPLNVVASNMLHTPVAFASIRTGISEVNMANGMQKDWRELCLAVTNESDSTKLTSLVQELIRALDEGEREWRHVICSPDASAMNRDAA